MTKVVTKPQTAKQKTELPLCWTCSKAVIQPEESRTWFRFSFCSISCMDLFKEKFN
jgi:hypothetical protein